MTNAEARFNKSLRPRKPEGSLGRTAQDVHLDSHTAPELWGVLKAEASCYGLDAGDARKDSGFHYLASNSPVVFGSPASRIECGRHYIFPGGRVVLVLGVGGWVGWGGASCRYFRGVGRDRGKEGGGRGRERVKGRASCRPVSDNEGF